MSENHKVLVLEPANFEQLRGGHLVRSPDNSVIVAFCPDILWMQNEILKLGSKLTPEAVQRMLVEGLGRADVTDRPDHPTWDAMKSGGTA